jgi:hypothetical protein
MIHHIPDLHGSAFNRATLRANIGETSLVPLINEQGEKEKEQRCNDMSESSRGLVSGRMFPLAAFPLISKTTSVASALGHYLVNRFCL